MDRLSLLESLGSTPLSALTAEMAATATDKRREMFKTALGNATAARREPLSADQTKLLDIQSKDALARVSSRPESYDSFLTSFPMPFEPVRAPVLTERATAARVVKKQSQVTSAVDEPENTEFPADLKAFLAAIGSDRRVVGSAAGALPTTDSEDDTDDMVDVPALPSTVAALQEDGEMTLADGTTTGRMHILATAALPSSRVHLNNFVDDDGSGSDPDVVFEDEISLPVSGGRAGVTLVDASVGVTSCPDAVDEVLPFDDGSESGNE